LEVFYSSRPRGGGEKAFSFFENKGGGERFFFPDEKVSKRGKELTFVPPFRPKPKTKATAPSARGSSSPMSTRCAPTSSTAASSSPTPSTLRTGRRPTRACSARPAGAAATKRTRRRSTRRWGPTTRSRRRGRCRGCASLWATRPVRGGGRGCCCFSLRFFFREGEERGRASLKRGKKTLFFRPAFSRPAFPRGEERRTDTLTLSLDPLSK